MQPGAGKNLNNHFDYRANTDCWIDDRFKSQFFLANESRSVQDHNRGFSLKYANGKCCGSFLYRKRVLLSATQSILISCAEVWAHALCKRLTQLQKCGVLRVAFTYRAEPVVMVIVGVILAKERKTIHQRTRGRLLLMKIGNIH